MKNQNRHGSVAKLLALLLSAVLLMGMLPMGAFADQTGSLTVKLKKDTYANLPRNEAVQVTLYQIGVAAPETKAGWEIDGSFSGYGVLNASSSSELADVAERIAADIVGKSEYTGTAKELSGGSTVFSGLEQGVYLGVLTDGPEGLEVDPFIVTVPSKDPETKALRYSYDVTLKDTCVTSATVRKIWDDNDNQDAIRPASLKVNLSNGQSVTLNEANGWEGTIENLPRYSGGQEITYSWEEEGLPAGYTLTNTATEGVITTLTNSHTPETISATVRKVWDDNDNQDAIRPASLKVNLSNGQSVTLNEANGWEGTIEGLPKYDKGQEITYSWEEEGLPAGYTLTNTATEGVITTLTNSHTPETVSATVRKVWDDSDNQDAIRPASLKVNLSNGQSVTLNEANGWTATIEGLPKYDKGQEIAYSWEEEGLPEGYKLTGTAVDGIVTTLTNSHTPETVSATVRKVWDDSDNQDGIRPVNLTVKLSDGQSVTLNEANGWTATIEGLPKYDKGQEIAYSWEEEGLPEGYKLTGTAVDGIVTTLTNSHTPETVSATVRKAWDDSDNQDGIRPAELTVTLSNGQSVTLNEANGWTATIENLPRYAAGEEIAYSWTEENLPEGYTLTGTTVDGTVTTLTNSHTPETVSATVRKVWNDHNNRDNIRPASLTVTLSNGQSVTLDASNGWTATVDNLPKYSAGQEINYTWTESSLPDGYVLTGNSTSGTVTTLTNSHDVPLTEVSGQKIWQDYDNTFNTRPESITVQLFADGELVNATPTWRGTRTGTWTYTFANLPAQTPRGNAIHYTVSELSVPNYTSRVEGTTITNTLIPRQTQEYKEITGVKTWVDGGNEGGMRPESITVHLIRNGEEVASLEVTAKTDWKYSFGMQPVDDGYGHLYEYEVREDGVPGYLCRVDGLNLINTLLPNTPGNPDNPNPGTPDTPYVPTGRRTSTPPPPFERYNEDELEEMIDIFDYGTPLWGGLLGTGDETPIYPYIFAGVGAVAVIALVVIFGRKRRKGTK